MGQAILVSTNSSRDVILFEEENGQELKENNTIVLKDDMKNYSRIKIYYKSKAGANPECLEFLTECVSYGPNGSGIVPSSIIAGPSNSYIKLAACRGTVATDHRTITFERNFTMQISSSGAVTIDSESGIIIYKIIGSI